MRNVRVAMVMLVNSFGGYRECVYIAANDFLFVSEFTLTVLAGDREILLLKQRL